MVVYHIFLSYKKKIANRSILPIDETPTGSSPLGPSGLGSNEIEAVTFTP